MQLSFLFVTVSYSHSGAVTVNYVRSDLTVRENPFSENKICCNAFAGVHHSNNSAHSVQVVFYLATSLTKTSIAALSDSFLQSVLAWIEAASTPKHLVLLM